MTEAAPGVSDIISTPAGSTPGAAPAGYVAPAIPNDIMAARSEIEARKVDRDFYEWRVQKKDPAATEYWDKLHKAAYPEQRIASTDDVNNQAAVRSAQMIEGALAEYLKFADLSPAQQDEYRRQQPVAAWEKEHAKREIYRMQRDAGFRRRLLDKDRAACTDWARMNMILALPLARTETTYPVKK